MSPLTSAAPPGAPDLVMQRGLVAFTRQGTRRAVNRTLLVVAHPDDEVIGAGTMLRYLPGLAICHVTDGAPRNLRDATRYGFASAEEYARARRVELARALDRAGVRTAPTFQLSIADQQTPFELVPLTRQIMHLFQSVQPDLVLTHAYEGGHPDHDACAFAVHAAATLAAKDFVCEFAGYHAGPGFFTSNCFLPGEPTETRVELTGDERRAKREMFDCFATQRETLSLFSVEQECFRRAPRYDFTRPPHAGPLYYERFQWGINASEFRRLTAAAMKSLLNPETPS